MSPQLPGTSQHPRKQRQSRTICAPVSVRFIQSSTSPCHAPYSLDCLTPTSILCCLPDTLAEADAYQAYQMPSSYSHAVYGSSSSSYSGAQQPYTYLPRQGYGGYAAHASRGYHTEHEAHTHQPLRGYKAAYGQDKYDRHHSAVRGYEGPVHQYPSAALYEPYYSSNPYARGAEVQQQQPLDPYTYQQAAAYRPSSSYLADAAVEYSVYGLDRAQSLQQQQQQQGLLTAPQMYRVTAEGAYPLPAAAVSVPVAAAPRQRQPTRVHFDDAYQALQQQVFSSARPGGALLGAGALHSHGSAYGSGYRHAAAYAPAAYSNGGAANPQSEQWWKDHNTQELSAPGQPGKASALDKLGETV